MIETRRLALDVRYNSYPFAGQVGGDIESLTYTDSAADNSDSIDITINAQDRKWLLGWMPEKGATLRARVLGYNWERQGQRSIMECGLFVLDDVSFSDAPTTLQVGGVSKPSDSDFSELERDVIWKNTSIKRIGAKIAARYGLAFTYDADDYDIECDEQDGTDSSYYNSLCKNYGLILKVYARRSCSSRSSHCSPDVQRRLDDAPLLLDVVPCVVPVDLPVHGQRVQHLLGHGVDGGVYLTSRDIAHRLLVQLQHRHG